MYIKFKIQQVEPQLEFTHPANQHERDSHDMSKKAFDLLRTLMTARQKYGLPAQCH